MFVDLDWPLNASSLLSASAELLVFSPGMCKLHKILRISYTCHVTNVEVRVPPQHTGMYAVVPPFFFVVLSPTWSLTDVCGSSGILRTTTVLSLRWFGGCLPIGSDRREGLSTPGFVQCRQTLANRTLALHSWWLAARCGHSNAPSKVCCKRRKKQGIGLCKLEH